LPTATTCPYGLIRAGSYDGSTYDYDVNGEQGNFYAAYSLRNISIAASISDIYIIDQAGDFFQFGWYEGSATGLPYTSTPRVFIGEFHAGSTNNEVLARNENAGDPSNYERYFAYVDGALVKESLYSHDTGRIGSTGEVDFNCIGMLNDWAQTSTPYPTLQYHRISTGSWYAWAQQYDSTNDPNCYAASRVGGASGTTYDYNTDNYGCP
jgi:hypothetical protein